MNSLKRWVIPLTLAVMTLAYGWVLVSQGGTEEAYRQLIRLSATTSLFLFALAWSASSLSVFLPGWRPVMQARRRVGIAFALSHTFHFAAIAMLVELAFDGDWSQVELVGGGFIYLFIYLMAATSNDAAVRLLGARQWRWLHWVGGYLIWYAFTQSYVGSVALEGRGGHYLVFAALCLGLLLLRVVAFWRKRVGFSRTKTS